MGARLAVGGQLPEEVVECRLMNWRIGVLRDARVCGWGK
jgi:hypothetical protein